MTDGFDDLKRRLLAYPRKRINFEDVLQIFLESRPEMADHPERVQHLLQALEELAQAKAVSLPRGLNGWTKTVNSRYPNWVVVPSREPARSIIAADEPWVKELSFCSTFISPQQIKAAQAINKFLILRRHELISVPLRERSLEIFGNEKRLDGMVQNGHLFDGRLPLSAIGAIEIPHYLVHSVFEKKSNASESPWRLLVIENHHTYWSICQWNAKAGIFDVVIYGAGLFFLKSEQFLDEIAEGKPEPRLYYFGDIDTAGFNIPVSVNSRRAAEGRQLLELYRPFYSWTLENGQPVKLSNTSSKGAVALSQQISNFIDVDIARRAEELLSQNLRIPQEALGLEVLMSGLFD